MEYNALTWFKVRNECMLRKQDKPKGTNGHHNRKGAAHGLVESMYLISALFMPYVLSPMHSNPFMHDLNLI
jgi:hypothetical protein